MTELSPEPTAVPPHLSRTAVCVVYAVWNHAHAPEGTYNLAIAACYIKSTFIASLAVHIYRFIFL
ncbi:MAG: hypothetical protein ABJB86_20655 [Bacteroidota bacterium]